jgi:hypothetical protein
MPSRAEWSASSAGFAGAILRLLASDGRALPIQLASHVGAPAPGNVLLLARRPRRPAARTASGGGFGRGAEPPSEYLAHLY